MSMDVNVLRWVIFISLHYFIYFIFLDGGVRGLYVSVSGGLDGAGGVYSRCC